VAALDLQFKRLVRQVLILRTLAQFKGSSDSHSLWFRVQQIDQQFYGPTFYGVIAALVRKNLIVVLRSNIRHSWSHYELTMKGRQALKKL
jgi:hypothetical protein